MKKIMITLLTAFVGGAVAIGAYKLMEDKYMDSLSLEEKQKIHFASNPLNIASTPGDVNFVPAAAAVTPAVVHINTTYESRGSGRNNSADDWFQQFFNMPQTQQAPPRASGSGVIISEDGYIVTNNHVVEDANKIEVILPDKRSYEAKVIGRDANTDLALIKVSANGLPVVKLGNSDNIQVGEWVLAVGYPFALNTTVTAGIISAKGRSIGIIGSSNRRQFNSRENMAAPTSSPIESFIQTDAAINPGNSGGALVNTNGELIGINSAIASQGGSYEGYGFAIPINLAKKVLEDFKEFGAIKRGYIGVQFKELDASVAKDLGITQINGLYVDNIIPGGGAEAAGLKKGDIITKVDNITIYGGPDLQERIGRLHPGDKVQLTYLRDGRALTTSVTLKDESANKLASAPSSRSAEERYNKLGASFGALSNAQKQKYSINSGLVVTDVRTGGIFEDQDIPKGSIITSVNGRPVNNRDDISAALAQGSIIRINGILPDGYRFRAQVQVP